MVWRRRRRSAGAVVAEVPAPALEWELVRLPFAAVSGMIEEWAAASAEASVAANA